jgi:adenylate cyclase
MNMSLFDRLTAAPLPSDPFERELARQMMMSERLRFLVLACVFGVVAVTMIVRSLLTPGVGPLADPTVGTVVRFLPLVFFVAAIAYELALRARLGRLLAREMTVREPLRYVNALVETSFPTFVLIDLSPLAEPQSLLTSPPAWMYFIFVILSILRLSPWLCVFTGTVAMVEYIALSTHLLRDVDPSTLSITESLAMFWTRAQIIFAAGIVAAFVSRQLRRQAMTSVESIVDRERVVSLFGQHVSPRVAERLLNQPVELGGETRQVCVMFLDIRGFTAFSEKHTPHQVVDYLNTLFGFMVDSINRHNGIVNKFLGDGFMAVFGAPTSDGRDCRNAVAASREILLKLNELMIRGEIPPTRIGIGLHTGEAVTGTIGSELRKEYTIIGDTVNVASRLEQLNKQYQSQLLISEDVALATDEAGEPLGELAVRGKSAPVTVFRLA